MKTNIYLFNKKKEKKIVFQLWSNITALIRTGFLSLNNEQYAVDNRKPFGILVEAIRIGGFELILLKAFVFLGTAPHTENDNEMVREL